MRGSKGGPGPGTRIAVAFYLLAFALQSFITQTHIHFPSADAGLLRVAVADSGGQNAGAHIRATVASNKKPVSPIDDPDKCPLCQEFLYAGNYVPPSALVLHLPSASVSAIAPEISHIVRVADVSHDWRGRAPPLS